MVADSDWTVYITHRICYNCVGVLTVSDSSARQGCDCAVSPPVDNHSSQWGQRVMRYDMVWHHSDTVLIRCDTVDTILIRF